MAFSEAAFVSATCGATHSTYANRNLHRHGCEAHRQGRAGAIDFGPFTGRTIPKGTMPEVATCPVDATAGGGTLVGRLS